MAVGPHILCLGSEWLVAVKTLTNRLKRRFPALDPENAEDAAQLAIVQAHQEKPDIPIPELPNHAYFKAVNELRRSRDIHLNGRPNHQSLPLTTDPPAPEPPPPPPPSHFDHPILTKPQKRLLRLRFKNDLTIAQIAQKTHIPPTTVHRRLKKILTVLQDALPNT